MNGKDMNVDDLFCSLDVDKIGGKLHARKFERQRTEAFLGCMALNQMTSLGMPVSDRVS